MGAFLLLLGLLLAQQSPAYSNDDAMVWPVAESRDLSATFCEYRPGHYHAGIDVAFGGRLGLPVRAVSSGVVHHVRSSHEGYGNVIYLRHGDGTMSVYAHLDSFAEPLQSMIAAEQARRNRYDVQIYPAEPVAYEAGEVIAYGGASGTSAPHLHLEIRGADNRLLNPITFFRESLQDRARPVAESVLVEPLDAESLLGGLPWPVSVDVRDAERRIVLPARGRFRFSVRGYDVQGAMRAKLGLYRIALIVNGETAYDLRYDRASWERGNEIGLTYRLEETGLGPTRYMYRLYGAGAPLEVLQGDDYIHSGEVDLSNLPEGARTEVQILLGDAFGNERRIGLDLKKEDGVLPQSAQYLSGREVLFGDERMAVDSRAGVFRFRVDASGGGGNEREFRLVNPRFETVRRIPLVRARNAGFSAGAFDLEGLDPGNYVLHDGEKALEIPLILYSPEGSNTLLVSADGGLEIFTSNQTAYYPEVLTVLPVEKSAYPQVEGMEMVVFPYCALPEGTPTADNFDIGLRVPRERREDPSLGIYAWDGEAGRWRFAGKDWRSNRLRVRVRTLGIFTVLADHSPPRMIASSPAPGARLSGLDQISIQLDDVGSGIDAERVIVRLDGRTLSGYFDRYKDTFFSDPLSELARGEHSIHVEAFDRAGNSTGLLEVRFTIR